MKNNIIIAALTTALIAGAVVAEEVRILPKTFTTLSESLPRDMKVSELKLREAGLKPTPLFKDADEIRVLESKDATSKSPVARIWINAAQTNAYWFHTGGKGSAEDYVLKQGSMVVIQARASLSMVTAQKP